MMTTCLKIGQGYLFFFHKTIFDHAQFISGQNISKATWVRNGLHWLSCQLQFFEIGYCGHPNFPYKNIQPEQASDWILSHFQKEDHSLIHDKLKNKKTQLVYLYYVYKPKKNKSITDITNYDEIAYKYVPTFGYESTCYHSHMISVVVCFLLKYTKKYAGILFSYRDGLI